MIKFEGCRAFRFAICPGKLYKKCVKKSGQLNLLKLNSNLAFGGASGNAKIARPICTKRPMHLIMKSSNAVRTASMMKKQNNAFVRRVLVRQAKKFGVRISRVAILGNHFHAIVFATNRRAFQNFLRSVASLIARELLPKCESVKKFWDGLAFTRVTEWGRALKILERYLVKNQFEADGFPTDVAIAMARENRPLRQRS